MNLVQELLTKDPSGLKEKKTEEIESEALSRLLGKDVKIKIREVGQRRLNDILAIQFDKKGNFDPQKSFDAKLMMIVEGVVEPSMKDKELRDHFGAGSPKDLAELLFQKDITKLSEYIAELSGMDDGEAENTIKNS